MKTFIILSALLTIGVCFPRSNLQPEPSQSTEHLQVKPFVTRLDHFQPYDDRKVEFVRILQHFSMYF